MQAKQQVVGMVTGHKRLGESEGKSNLISYPEREN